MKKIILALAAVATFGLLASCSQGTTTAVSTSADSNSEFYKAEGTVTVVSGMGKVAGNAVAADNYTTTTCTLKDVATKSTVECKVSHNGSETYTISGRANVTQKRGASSVDVGEQGVSAVVYKIGGKFYMQANDTAKGTPSKDVEVKLTTGNVVELTGDVVTCTTYVDANNYTESKTTYAVKYTLK